MISIRYEDFFKIVELLADDYKNSITGSESNTEFFIKIQGYFTNAFKIRAKERGVSESTIRSNCTEKIEMSIGELKENVKFFLLTKDSTKLKTILQKSVKSNSRKNNDLLFIDKNF